MTTLLIPKKCSDIPDKPILEFLSKHSKREKIGDEWRDYGWCNWYFGNEKDVRQAMPEGTPEILVLRKMQRLQSRGCVGGCSCGCRGDYVLTEKGWNLLKMLQCPPPPNP